MSPPEPVSRVEAIRRFNRFYTRQLGLLQEHLLDSPFTLSEARVIYELAQHQEATARQLVGELQLDAGYLSRILRRLHQRRLLGRRPSPTDGREKRISLTQRGQQSFAQLNAASQREIEAVLGRLTEDEQRRLVQGMAAIMGVLGAGPEHHVPYLLRPHQTGDMGWVVQRHGVLYAREYGWDERFEALVARIVADFVENFDPSRERCWIAEKDGENVGSVFLVKHPQRQGVAKLRLLLVEPKARGLGIGGRLVTECSRFARQAGYQTITLWTNSVLVSARRLYEREGYCLLSEEPHDSFGQALIGQTWELAL